MMAVDGYPIDIWEKEGHSWESDITDHPIEEGSDFSDNIRNKPGPSLDLQGVVSDTPIGEVASDPTRAGGDGAPLPSSDAFTKIMKIREAREPVTIVTSLGRWESMALQKLDVPRDAKTLKGLVFTATFRKVEIKKNKRVTVAIPNGGAGSGLGHRESEEWGKRFKIKDAIFVITAHDFQVATYTKLFGPPVKATAKLIGGVQRPVPKGEFYFEVRGDAKPDAYIKGGVVNPFSVQNGTSNELGTQRLKDLGFATGADRVGPDPLNYNYGKKAWTDKNGNTFVKEENPSTVPEGFTPDTWRQRQMGWSPGTAPKGV